MHSVNGKTGLVTRNDFVHQIDRPAKSPSLCDRITALWNAFVGWIRAGWVQLSQCWKPASKQVKISSSEKVGQHQAPQRISVQSPPQKVHYVINFFNGNPDENGRTFDSILNKTNPQLEAGHDWVQQVFPTRRPSDHRPQDAEFWVVTDEVAAHLRTPPCQERLQRAFNRILDFYGLRDRQLKEYAKSAILPRWVTNGNHNFKRLTRILESLKIAGLDLEAQDLMNRLNQVHDLPKAKKIIQGSIICWRNAFSGCS